MAHKQAMIRSRMSQGSPTRGVPPRRLKRPCRQAALRPHRPGEVRVDRSTGGTVRVADREADKQGEIGVGRQRTRRRHNKDMHRSRRSHVHVVVRCAARRPGNVRRWAPSSQPLMCEAVRARDLVRCATRLQRLAPKPRQAPPRRSTGNRHCEARHRLGASYRSRAPSLRANPYLARAAISA